MADKTEQDLRRDLRSSWESCLRAERSLEAVDREVALAEKNLILSERDYEAGSITQLELDQARMGLQSAKIAQLGERMERELSAAELLLAAGLYRPAGL